MRYRAREAGFIGRRVKAGEVFDFDGDIPWADPVEPEADIPAPAPKTGKPNRGKKAAEDAEDDAI